MEYFQTIDPGIIIHHLWTEKDLIATSIISNKPIISQPYARMLDLQAPNNQGIQFTCMTKITTTRPITEYKPTHNALLQKLHNEGIFLQQTTLNLLDTLELGMFIGLHPLLTNI